MGTEKRIVGITNKPAAHHKQFELIIMLIGVNTVGEVIAIAVLINVLTSVAVGMITPKPEAKPVQVEIVNEYECKVGDIIVK